MKIYHDRIEVGEVPNWNNKDGKILGRLIGINISEKEQNFVVEPVYLPLINITDHGGIIAIQLSLKKPWLVIYLMQRRPFIYISRITEAIPEEG